MFTEIDIYRLHQILMLKQSGLSIQVINEILSTDKILPSLIQAEKEIHEKINKLVCTRRKLKKLISYNNVYKINEIIFLEKPTRYFQKIPKKFIDSNGLIYSKNMANNLDNFENLSYVLNSSDNFLTCLPCKKKSSDFLFPKGMYISKSVAIHDEIDLKKEVYLFLETPLAKSARSLSKNLLIYENVECSLTYSKKMIFTMEVEA